MRTFGEGYRGKTWKDACIEVAWRKQCKIPYGESIFVNPILFIKGENKCYSNTPISSEFLYADDWHQFNYAFDRWLSMSYKYENVWDGIISKER